jgi:putative hydroxymethylpyrimidine transport system substrate-binding protein
MLGCGGDGAEPGAPAGATLVLDFEPNAVHSGIYTAQARDFFENDGVEMTIRQPTSSSDAPKLLEAGRVEFAVMDINDFGIARERGLDVVAIGAIVQRPLASVIAADRNEVRSPADLRGKTIGVTGVPSDDAVLDTVLASGGVDPASVKRVTIGFDAVSALAAGRIDAATAFWNAEGVQLEALGLPVREFRVDRFGAPRYPELVLVSSRETLDETRRIACATTQALGRGYDVLGSNPAGALDDLIDEVPGLERDSQQAQLDALTGGDAFSSSEVDSPATIQLPPRTTRAWIRWAERRGLLRAGPGSARKIAQGFDLAVSAGCRSG